MWFSRYAEALHSPTTWCPFEEIRPDLDRIFSSSFSQFWIVQCYSYLFSHTSVSWSLNTQPRFRIRPPYFTTSFESWIAQVILPFWLKNLAVFHATNYPSSTLFAALFNRSKDWAACLAEAGTQIWVDRNSCEKCYWRLRGCLRQAHVCWTSSNSDGTWLNY